MKKSKGTLLNDSAWKCLIVLIFTWVAIPMSVSANDAETEEHTHIKSGETCFICDPSLRDKGRLWCSEHSRYEDRCWLCHPEMQDKDRMWCKEHSLYEDECYLCHPKPLKKDEKDKNAKIEKCSAHGDDKSQCFVCDSSLREKGRLWCREHDRYEDRCWLCHPEMQDKSRMWCKEHSLYEDECYLCHPELLKKDQKENKPKASVEQCAAHAVNKEACYICDTSVRQKGRLWCKEHNRYEDRCWLCHSEMQDKDRKYCKEHYLYEDECFYCNPGLLKTSQNSSSPSNESAVLLCKEHDVFEHECGICQPQLATDLQPGQSMKVRFVSDQSTIKAGVATARPLEAMSSPGVPSYFQVSYNQNELAHITPLASGVTKKVYANLGQKVDAGDVLLVIHSSEVAESKVNYLSSIVDFSMKEAAFDREKKLVEQKISAKRDFLEAKAAKELAALNKKTTHQKLYNLGFLDDDIKFIEQYQDSSSMMKIRAPFAGTIVSRNAVMGEWVEAGSSVFSLANLSQMWLELSIAPENLAQVKVGLEVEATFGSLPDMTVKGQVTWVDTSVDTRSRMFKARAVIPNQDGLIRKGMFGQARIIISPGQKTLLVPKNSIQHYEKNPYLFVKEESDLYALRRVTLGNKTEDSIEIIAGINPTEQVVVTGAFTVMSEYLKSRLGAGCVDD